MRVSVCACVRAWLTISNPSFVPPPSPGFNADCRDLVKKLLSRDEQTRLGNLKGGIQDILDHKWFMGYDWGLYLKKQVKAPMVPKIKGDLDTSHFDPLGVDDHTDDGGYVDRGDWDRDF